MAVQEIPCFPNLRSRFVASTKVLPILLSLALPSWLSVNAQESVSYQTAIPAAKHTYHSGGDGWHRFWSQVELHRRRVNAWPQPFATHDRELVRGPFRQMADNGWKSQNTFTDYLFDPQSHELTLAGHAKLRHLLTQLPPHRRQVYVVEGLSPEETAARVASVYQAIAQIAPEAGPCAVMTTKIAPRGSEGWYTNEIEEAYRDSVAAPLQRYISSSGMGAASSASSAGASNNQSGGSNGANSGNNGN